MSKLPTMPFLVDAYIADTTHLSLEEHGAYLLLLFAMWRRDGFLPDIDGDNARLLGVPVKHWLKLKERLAPFLIVANGRLSQKRLQLQWNKAMENSQRQAIKGRKGGLANAETQKLLHMKRSQCQSARSSPGLSSGPSPEASPEVATISNKDKPTTSQEDRGPSENFTSVHRLLQTAAMRRTG